MIRRPPRSTLDRSSAASDVYKRQDNEINEGMRGIFIEDVANDFMIEENDLVTSFYYGGINTRIFIKNAKLDPTEGVIYNNDLLIDDALASTGIHLINTTGISAEENDIIFMNDEEHQTRGIIGVGAYRCNICLLYTSDAARRAI